MTANAKAIMTAKDIISADKLEAKIRDINTKGQSFQRSVHIAAVSILAHLEKHNDTRIILPFLDKLMAALPKALRTNAVRAWFEFHSPVCFGKKDEITLDKAKTYKLAAAMVTPFWEFAAEAPYEPMNIDKFLKQAIAKLERDAKESNRDHSILLTNLKMHRTNPNVIKQKVEAQPAAN